MGVLFCWARPRFLVVLLDLRRNANLAGGFAGRRVLAVRFVYVYLICLHFLILANRAEYHFFHRLCIYQDRATSIYGQTRGKKGEFTTVFVHISADTGLDQVHPTWAGTYVLNACVFLFPTIHFALIDSDCVPVTLFEVQELWWSSTNSSQPIKLNGS